jgi:hypothetical protein
MYYPVETRITPQTTIRRERLLPNRGQVLVERGETVNPADVVARCLLPGKIQLVNASQALHVPRERVAKYMVKSVGDPVQVDEVLATPGGLLGRLRRACRSPVEGEILAIRDGFVLIEAAPLTVELRAHLKGEVTSVMPNLGVVISTVGLLIQGIWGSGGEAEGVLKLLVDNPQKPVLPRAIDVSCHGTLVVGGWIMDEKPLQQAVEAKVRGMVVGSANASLRSTMEELPFPVILTEGFGTQPMSNKLFELLESNKGREVMISADTQTRWNVRRPEIIIPVRPEGSPAPEPGKPQALAVGQQVRVMRAPHMGAIGTITDLSPYPKPVESGSRVRVAEISLGSEQSALVPVANLELIR